MCAMAEETQKNLDATGEPVLSVCMLLVTPPPSPPAPMSEEEGIGKPVLPVSACCYSPPRYGGKETEGDPPSPASVPEEEGTDEGTDATGKPLLSICMLLPLPLPPLSLWWEKTEGDPGKEKDPDATGELVLSVGMLLPPLPSLFRRQHSYALSSSDRF